MNFSVEFPANAAQICPLVQARFSPMRDGRPDGAAILSEAVPSTAMKPGEGKK
jgi:hypothetical protein